MFQKGKIQQYNTQTQFRVEFGTIKLILLEINSTSTDVCAQTFILRSASNFQELVLRRAKILPR